MFWASPSSGNFNSRPHEEVDFSCLKIFNRYSYFNSRPHEEVDEYFYDNSRNCKISTHDLTKRSTCLDRRWIITMEFQLTTSRRGRRLYPIPLKERSIFQLTTSRRGRRHIREKIIIADISTHDLTKRSTMPHT